MGIVRALSTLGRLGLVAVLMCGFVGIADAYVGTLTLTEGGLQATGNWEANGPTRIDWDVHYDSGNGWWTYTYELSHPANETSHLLLEVSQGFDKNDLFDASGDFDKVKVKTYHAGRSNPNLPESIRAIKFDDAWGMTTRMRFSSYYAPKWGDFYAKSERVNGEYSTGWNSGFLADDPTGPIGSGSLAGHILVPDAVTQPIPEPGSVLLLGLGLLGLAGVRARRNAMRG